MSDSINHIFDIPVKNLEKRIKELNSELDHRIASSTDFIKNIEWEKSRLDTEMNEFKGYFVSTNNTPLLLKRIELEQSINLEKINCLRDVFMIREKIRYAEERLLSERHKKRLIHGRNKGAA